MNQFYFKFLYPTLLNLFPRYTFSMYCAQGLATNQVDRQDVVEQDVQQGFMGLLDGTVQP